MQKLMQKKIPAWVWRLTAFLLIAAVVLVYLTGLFWNRTGTTMPFYAEQPGTLDVLFFGSSKSNAAIAPVRMYEQYGFTGYVLYSWSQPVWTSYYYIRDAFKTQQPQVIVLEGNALLYGRRDEAYTNNLNAVNNANALLIPASLDRLALAWTMGQVQTDHPSFFSTLSLGRYHTNWKTLTAQDWLWPLWRPQPLNGKGYGPLYISEAFDAPPVASDVQNADIYPACLDYLQKSIDYVRAQGAALVLAFYPDALLTQEDMDRMAYLRAYCAAQEVPVVDMAQRAGCDAAGMDFAVDMADYAHVNYKGAQKVTDWLAAYLWENYQLPDHRADAAYAMWADSVAAERLDAHRMQMRLETELAPLLEMADEAHLVLLYAWGDMTLPGTGDTGREQNRAALADALALYGQSAQVLQQTDASALWVWQDGQLVSYTDYSADLAGHALQAAPNEITLDGQLLNYQRDGLGIVVVALDGSWHFAATWGGQYDYTRFTA